METLVIDNDIKIEKMENVQKSTPEVLGNLVTILEEQKKAKKDYVVPAGSILYNGTTGMLDMINGFHKEQYVVSEHTHNQIATKLEIPTGYYKRMLTGYPQLLADNINGWLSKKEKTNYLLRTFNYPDKDKIVRALLSNKYNIIDNWDVLVAALEAIKKTGVHVEIIKAEVTDSRMYIHVVAPEIHIEATKLLDGYLENLPNAKTNNGIISGMVISNSEIGLSRFEISARAQILRCQNGMHDRNAAFKKTHLGAKMEEGEIEWSQNTKNKNYELIIAQVQDAVKRYLSMDYLGQLTTRLERYKESVIEQPIQIIELVNQELGINEVHAASVLKHFLKDGDESVFGMMNAYTRVSQKLDADSQYEVESKIFDLLPKMEQWNNKLLSAN